MTAKELKKVQEFKDHIYTINTKKIGKVVINRIDEALERGYRVMYVVDGKEYLHE